MASMFTLATAQQDSPEHIAKRVGKPQRNDMRLLKRNLETLRNLRVLGGSCVIFFQTLTSAWATHAQTVHPVWMASMPTHANVQRVLVEYLVILVSKPEKPESGERYFEVQLFV